MRPKNFVLDTRGIVLSLKLSGNACLKRAIFFKIRIANCKFMQVKFVCVHG